MPSSNTQRPYYGWHITYTLAVTETISWGIIYYAFSVFLTPMERELGWSRAELTFGFSLMWLVAGVMAYPVGAWLDRYGPRALMTAGSIGASVLIVAWSQVSTLRSFYLIWFGLGVCAAAVLYEPAFAIIAKWFHHQRGKAMAIVTFAAGLASTIFLPLSDLLSQHFGWRGAVLILGILLAITTIPLHAIVLRNRSAALDREPDGLALNGGVSKKPQRSITFRTALRGRLFWLLTLGFGLISLSAAAIRVHFIPFLISEGIESQTAAVATGSIGIMQVLGRAIFAPLEHRLTMRTMVVGVFALHVIAMFVLLLGQSYIQLAAFIIVFGIGQGAVTLARPSITAEVYGVSHYGRISSIMALCLTLTSTSAPLIASLLYDRVHSYQPVLGLITILACAATATIVVAIRDCSDTIGNETCSDPIADLEL